MDDRSNGVDKMHKGFLSGVLVPVRCILLAERGRSGFLHMLFRVLYMLRVLDDAIPDERCCSLRNQARGEIAGSLGIGFYANGYLFDILRQVSLWDDGARQWSPYYDRYTIWFLSGHSYV